jgi:hypothetical protein
MYARISLKSGGSIDVDNVKSVTSRNRHGEKREYIADELSEFNLGGNVYDYTIIGDQYFSATAENTWFVYFA